MRLWHFLFIVGLLAVLPPSTTAQSWQNQMSFTAGPQVPTGSLAQTFNTGVGLAGTYYYRTSSHFFVGLRGGYHRLENPTQNVGWTVVPLHFASKINFSLTGLQPYLGLTGGAYIVEPDGSDDGRVDAGAGPQFGFRLPVAWGLDIDLNATYEVLFSESDSYAYVGLNAGLAYIFGR